MPSHLSQNTLHGEVEEVACERVRLSATSHGITNSKRSIPTSMGLQELLYVILHSLISSAGIPSLDIVAKTRSLLGLSKAAL